MNDYSSDVLKLILSDSRPFCGAFADVRRSELYELLKNKGYAERTIKNLLALSNKNSMVYAMVRDGLFVEKICGGWRVDIDKLKNYKRRQAKQPRFFDGKKPEGEGWIDGGELNTEWAYCYKSYIKKDGSTGFNFKLFALKSTEHKANFWLAYDNKKFKLTRDLPVLIEKNKELYALFLDAVARDGRFS
jgi:hypothetical protein